MFELVIFLGCLGCCHATLVPTMIGGITSSMEVYNILAFSVVFV